MQSNVRLVSAKPSKDKHKMDLLMEDLESHEMYEIKGCYPVNVDIPDFSEPDSRTITCTVKCDLPKVSVDNMIPRKGENIVEFWRRILNK